MKNLISDHAKMSEFFRLSKEEFLKAYSDVTESEYAETERLISLMEKLGEKMDIEPARFRIQISEEHDLVAEVNSTTSDISSPDEVSIYIADRDNTVIQDVCAAVVQDESTITCYVWGEEDDESYTEAFAIPIYSEPEE